MNIKSKGFFNIFLATIFVVFDLILVDYTYQYNAAVGAMDFFFWGFVGTAIFGSAYVLPQKKYYPELSRQLRHSWKLLLTISLLTFFSGFLFFLALETVSAGLVSVFYKSDVLFAIVLGIIFLNERVGRLDWLMILISLLGFLMLSSLEGEIKLLEVLMIVFSAAFYSFQSLYVKKYAGQLNSIVLSYLRAVFVAVFISFAYLIFFDPKIFDLITTALIVISQVFGIFLYRIYYFEAHKYMDIGILNIFLLMVPVLTLIAGVVLFADPVSYQKLLGAGLVIFSITILYKHRDLDKA